MKLLNLVRGSALYHWRGYLGTMAGVAVACAVITGALLVGDSVRASLRRIADERLRQVSVSILTGDRFFTVALDDRLRDQLDVPLAAAIQLDGMVLLPDESRRVNRVRILGVDPEFWSLGDAPPASGIVLNRRLAERLGVEIGDAIVLRVANPGLLPRDASLSPADDAFVSWRATVGEIRGAESFGNFNLELNQVAPYNLFIPRDQLAAELGRAGRANLLLVGGASTIGKINEALPKLLELEDAGFAVQSLPDGETVELRSSQIFMRDSLAAGAAALSPDSVSLLTWFVNSLRLGERVTPYSMVTATDQWAELGDDGMVLNQWAAEDLEAAVGDTVTIEYFLLDAGNRLIVDSADFVIRQIIPMDDPRLDAAMMPDFPGLSDAENCRSWDTGVPIELARIRPRDEAYWGEYRGTPKALISLSAGQRLWRSRFGAVTAVRLPATPEVDEQLRDVLLGDPAAVGFVPVPIAELSTEAYRNSLDFSQYFLAFSIFLIIAALLLTGLLFNFSLKRRLTEVGTLVALGFSRRRVRLFYIAESAALAVPAVIIGACLGIGYTMAILHGLTHVWQDAVGTWPIQFSATITSLAGGAVATFIVAVATIWYSGRLIARWPVPVLLAGGRDAESTVGHRPRRPIWSFLGFTLLLLGIAIIVFGAILELDQPLVFFLAGTLLLVGALSAFNDLLYRLARLGGSDAPGLTRLGLRNLSRHRGRSLAVAAILGCGAFLVLALESQRLHRQPENLAPSGGTGGFSLFAQATLPLHVDLNTYGAREDLGLIGDPRIPPFSVLQLRLRAGDEASCLNLNRAQRPRLAALDSRTMQARRAFTFLKLAPDVDPTEPWSALRQTPEPRVINAFTDLNSLTYTMGRAVGDIIHGYTDEQGRELGIRIAGALDSNLLRGMLIVDEEAYLQHFPSSSGYAILMVDSRYEDAALLAETLNRALAEHGVDFRPSSEVLAEYDRVQNTYISIFQVLGGLGLLLGSVGLGLLVVNHVLERRPELALMRAVGYPRGWLSRLLIVEHLALYAAGLTVGAIAAAAAVMPLLMRSGPGVPWHLLALLMALLGISGILWIILAAVFALRGDLLSALRRE